MRPFRTVKAPSGWMIAIHAFAYATDESGNSRFVARWHRHPASGLYILQVEHDRNPPNWLELTCAALPQRTQT